jgi:hypothetical protein
MREGASGRRGKLNGLCVHAVNGTPKLRRVVQAGHEPYVLGATPMEASYISSLQTKHAGLEKQIHDELTRPSPDLSALKMLKLRKLRIKDEIFKH